MSSSVTKVITRDTGTPLWFTVTVAIATIVAMIAAVGIFINTSKVKKGSGYGSKSNGAATPTNLNGTCNVP